jgi:uncharacterized membrane protein YphA (DoxX/SURF4 family)
MVKRTTIIETIVILNVILFLYTGIAKIMDYSVFKEQLADSPILGFAAKPVAILLPVVEFIVVILLAIPRWRLKGLYSSLALMLAFTAYIISMFIVSPEMPCSCGGIIELLSWEEHLVFNSVFLLLDALAVRLSLREINELNKKWNEAQSLNVSHG